MDGQEEGGENPPGRIDLKKMAKNFKATKSLFNGDGFNTEAFTKGVEYSVINGGSVERLTENTTLRDNQGASHRLSLWHKHFREVTEKYKATNADRNWLKDSQFKLYTVAYSLHHSKVGFNSSMAVEALSEDHALANVMEEVTKVYGKRLFRRFTFTVN